MVLILIGYSFLLAVRVKMQKLSIEMEREAKTGNRSTDDDGGSKVKKRSADMDKAMGTEVQLQKNSR